MSGMAEVIAAHVRAVKAEEAAHPERTALVAVMRDNIAWTLEAEPALRKLADAILAAGFGPVKEAGAVALEEAAAIFAGRLPDGTGNGRAYNSYQVADMLRARAAKIRASVA